MLDHYELFGNENAIELTVLAPDHHTRDKDHANREIYYRRGALPPPDDQDFLKVVVAYRTTETGSVIGRVVTAYAIRRISRGERTIWTSPTNTSTSNH